MKTVKSFEKFINESVDTQLTENFKVKGSLDMREL
jgi:hypothetical protein